MHEREDGGPYHFEYQALNGLEAVCELRLYHHAGKTIVVATDADVGPSVTNNVEVIATLLRQRGIAFDLFCEHYQRDHLADMEETFDWVTFTWQGAMAAHPDWKPGSREQLEAAIGRPFD